MVRIVAREVSLDKVSEGAVVDLGVEEEEVRSRSYLTFFTMGFYNCTPKYRFTHVFFAVDTFLNSGVCVPKIEIEMSCSIKSVISAFMFFYVDPTRIVY